VDTKLRVHLDQQVHVVRQHFQRLKPRAVLGNHVGQDDFQLLGYWQDQQWVAVLRAEDHVVGALKDHVVVGTKRRTCHAQE
jgi:hypothetical protein